MRVRNDGATVNHGGVHGEGSVVSIRASARVWLYGVVVFAAAWLVFWIQPLAVRGVLPALGGSPAVWNTAMVFFQSALLAGYALAHLLIRRASPPDNLPSSRPCGLASLSRFRSVDFASWETPPPIFHPSCGFSGRWRARSGSPLSQPRP